jgi:hypothetical protein
MEPTPTVFPIRANFSFVPGRWWRVKVALAPGRIVYSPGRRFEFVHTNQLVYVVHSRLFPPPTMLTQASS